MYKKYFLLGTKFILLGFTILTIPQCSPKKFYDWFSPSSENKSYFDMKKLDGKENVFPIVVIGAGPAGDSAGIYGARAKKKTLVIEGPKPGGLLTETTYVENWPGFKAILGKDLMKELKEHAMHFGAQFLDDTVEKIDFSQWPYVIWTDDGKKIYALTVIIATGASPLSLNIPGEKEYWAKGVATCAVCDAPFYQSKEVVVIGGGDSAIAESLQLSPYAKKITILVRKDKMRAAPTNQELLAGHKHVSIQYNVEPKKVIGDGKRVTGIELYNNKDNTTYTMPVDGVFLAIGHKPNTDLFKEQLELDNHGYIILKGRSQETSKKGVYAAGDVEDYKYRQAGVASSSGIKAALEADEFLNEIGLTADISARLEKTQLAPVTITPSLVKHVASLKEFETEMQEAQKPVIVDFYADYCPSCMAMLPHFNAVSEQFKDYALFISVDIVALPDIASKYFITKIPCILVFKDGAMVARYNTAMTKPELEAMVAQFVGQTSAEK